MMDALFRARKLLTEYLQKDRKLYLCLVDLRKAFDRVPRKMVKLSRVLQIIVKAVMSLYEGAITKVRLGSVLSDKFSLTIVVHEGTVLSPFSSRNGVLQEILYADDLVLMSESIKVYRESLVTGKPH